eukprot:1144584-Pelagomonas_calceolata.AAC.1
MKRVPRTNSPYPLRSRGGCVRNREHSAPATATPPAFKISGPRISLRPQSSSIVTSVVIFQGPQLKSPSIPSELGLDTHTATKLALKLHALYVQNAYKLASTRRPLKKAPLNSHQDQARSTGDTWCLIPSNIMASNCQPGRGHYRVVDVMKRCGPHALSWRIQVCILYGRRILARSLFNKDWDCEYILIYGGSYTSIQFQTQRLRVLSSCVQCKFREPGYGGEHMV